jgi:hypothetical protein
MKDRAYRYLPIAILGFALLVVLPGLAAADESAAPGRAFAAVVPAQAARCGACALAQESCSAKCFGREDKAGVVACLTGCDNAAATCSCDAEVTLSSEDLVAKMPWLSDKAAACHSTTPCGSAYPSCASWSGYSDCDDPFCGVYRWCGDCPDPEFGCFGPALRQRRERFRVCFNELGQSCTEYQRTSVVLGCDC